MSDVISKKVRKRKRRPSSASQKQVASPETVSKKKRLSSQKAKKSKLKRNGKNRKKKRRRLIGKTARHEIKRGLVQLGLSLGIAVFLIWLASFFLFTISMVREYGMLPTLGQKESVFVNRLAKVERFDLVLIQRPGAKEKMIRRVIGLPGESVVYRNDQLFVDNQELEELFIQQEVEEATQSNNYFTEDFSLYQIIKEDQIPEGHYLVLGDNRPYATDSRYFGAISRADILGVVDMRFLPIHKMRMLSIL